MHATACGSTNHCHEYVRWWKLLSSLQWGHRTWRFRVWSCIHIFRVLLWRLVWRYAVLSNPKAILGTQNWWMSLDLGTCGVPDYSAASSKSCYSLGSCATSCTGTDASGYYLDYCCFMPGSVNSSAGRFLNLMVVLLTRKLAVHYSLSRRHHYANTNHGRGCISYTKQSRYFLWHREFLHRRAIINWMIFTRFCRLMHLQINMRQHLTQHPTQMATMAKSSISPASEVPAQTQPANELMLYGAPILIAPISAGVSISSRTFLESLQITLIQIRSLRMLVRFHGRKLLHLADFQSPISEYWPDCFSFVGFGAG